MVEIMIVLVLIGVLGALAVAAHHNLASRSRYLLLQNELRVASNAMEAYATEQGGWPPDGGGGWPAAANDYLPPPNRWTRPTPLGGSWSWVRGVDGVEAALRISGYEGGLERGLEVDRLIDDGNLSAGILRGSSEHLLYVMQE